MVLKESNNFGLMDVIYLPVIGIGSMYLPKHGKDKELRQILVSKKTPILKILG